MPIDRHSVNEHRQKYGVMYMITLLGSLLPILTIGGIILTSFDKLATDIEVTQQVSAHYKEAHEQLERTVDNIYLLGLQDRIEKLLIFECQNPQMRDVLEREVRELVREYNQVSNTMYRRPSCQELQVG